MTRPLDDDLVVAIAAAAAADYRLRMRLDLTHPVVLDPPDGLRPGAAMVDALAAHHITLAEPTKEATS